MSLGIISRAGRTYQDSAGYDLIQTDAGAMLAAVAVHWQIRKVT